VSLIKDVFGILAFFAIVLVWFCIRSIYGLILLLL